MTMFEVFEYVLKSYEIPRSIIINDECKNLDFGLTRIE